MLYKKGYLSNLYSCIRHLGNQYYRHKYEVRLVPGNLRLDHKMENSQEWQLKNQKNNILEPWGNQDSWNNRLI